MEKIILIDKESARDSINKTIKAQIEQKTPVIEIMKKIQKLNLDDDKKREAIKLQLTKDNENMS